MPDMIPGRVKGEHPLATSSTGDYAAPKAAQRVASADLDTALVPFKEWRGTAPLMQRHAPVVEELRTIVGYYDDAEAQLEERAKVDAAAAYEGRQQLTRDIDAKVDAWQSKLGARFEPYAKQATKDMEASLADPARGAEIRAAWKDLDPVKAGLAVEQADDETFRALYRAPKRPTIDERTKATRMVGILDDGTIERELARRRPVEYETVQAVEQQRRVMRGVGELVRHIVGRRAERTGTATVRQQYLLRGQMR